MSEFKTGDKVQGPEGQEYTVEVGPQTCYKVRAVGDEPMWQPASSLSLVPSEDPRVEVVISALLDHHGRTRSDVPEYTMEGAVQEVHAILEALDAMPKARRALDNYGDTWEEGANGRWTCVKVDDAPFPDAVDEGYGNWSWSRLTDQYDMTILP